MVQVIEHPEITQTIRTGYPYNGIAIQSEVARCECGTVARMEIKGQHFCFNCADDAHEVRML